MSQSRLSASQLTGLTAPPSQTSLRAASVLSSEMLAKYDRPSDASSTSSASPYGAGAGAGASAGAGAAGALSSVAGGLGASVVQQLKTNLINSSAELLITKGQVEQLTRERDRQAAALADLQQQLAQAQRDSARGGAMHDELQGLRDAHGRAQSDARASQERLVACMEELEHERSAATAQRSQTAQMQREAAERERSTTAALRAQLSQAQRDLTETAGDKGRTTREAEKLAQSLQSQLSDVRSSLQMLQRERDDLAGRLEAATRSQGDRVTGLEQMLEAQRREAEECRATAEEQRNRAAVAARESEGLREQVAQATQQLQRSRGELQATQQQQQQVHSTLQARVEALQAAKLKAETEAARSQTSADSALAERDRITQKWRAAENRAAELDSVSMQIKAQLSDTLTQLQIQQSRASAGSSAMTAAAAKTATPAMAEEDAALRKHLRELEADRDSVRDLLASIVPLPQFVRERALESAGHIAAAAAAATGADGTDSASGEMSALSIGGRAGLLIAAGSSPAARSLGLSLGLRGPLLAGSRRVSVMHAYGGPDEALDAAVGGLPSSVAAQLRALASERPMIVDALTFMDMQLRTLRADKDRLHSSLEAAKNGEHTHEASLVSLRRQLNETRKELAAIADAKDAAVDKMMRCETDLRQRASDLAQANQALAAEAQRRETLQRALDETRSQLAAATDELESLRTRMELIRVDFEHQVAMERTLKESTAAMQAAQNEEIINAHAQDRAALKERMAGVEAELEASRAEASALHNRVAQAAAETDRARGENAALSGRLGQTELALQQAEGQRDDLSGQLRESEAHAARAEANFADVRNEKDVAVHRLQSLASDMQLVHARVEELEAREHLLHEEERRTAALMQALAESEAAKAQASAGIEAVEQRLGQLREQARIELELAQRGTQRISEELQRVMACREEDALAAAQLTASSARSVSAMQAELAGQQEEASALRERCRHMQHSLAQLAAEVQDQRDQARVFHDEATRARSELLAESDRAGELNRALTDQLDAIKADFFSFLSLFHPAEAAAVAFGSSAAGIVSGGASSLGLAQALALGSGVGSGASSGAASGAGSSSRSPPSASSGHRLSPHAAFSSGSALSGVGLGHGRDEGGGSHAMMADIMSDMAQLKGRLDVLSVASMRASNAAAGR